MRATRAPPSGGRQCCDTWVLSFWVREEGTTRRVAGVTQPSSAMTQRFWWLLPRTCPASTTLLDYLQSEEKLVEIADMPIARGLPD
jgi:hypothetical protein